jgi:hypothetical protein
MTRYLQFLESLCRLVPQLRRDCSTPSSTFKFLPYLQSPTKVRTPPSFPESQVPSLNSPCAPRTFKMTLPFQAKNSQDIQIKVPFNAPLLVGHSSSTTLSKVLEVLAHRLHVISEPDTKNQHLSSVAIRLGY